MSTVPVKISVPLAHCEPYSLGALPYTTDSRIDVLASVIRYQGYIDAPQGFIDESRFVITKHWDYVNLLRDTGQDTVEILLGTYSLAEKLRMSIVDHVRSLSLPWISLSRAIHNAKSHLAVNDVQLSQLLGISRPMVSRHNVIAKSLNQGFQVMAEKGLLTFSLARQLVLLPQTKQAELLEQASLKGWRSRDIQAFAFTNKVPKALRSQSVIEQEYKETKSIEIRRAETTISERIGYPTTINEQPEGQGGVIEYAFYDGLGMVEVMTKMRKAFDMGVVPKGKISISYDNSNEFNRLTHGFFDEDY